LALDIDDGVKSDIVETLPERAKAGSGSLATIGHPGKYELRYDLRLAGAKTPKIEEDLKARAKISIVPV
jgi:hypothetical protein